MQTSQQYGCLAHALECRATHRGITLIFPWSYKLKRSDAESTKFELRAHDQNQDWFWHSSGCCFWGSPGWWAVKVVPTSLCC